MSDFKDEFKILFWQTNFISIHKNSISTIRLKPLNHEAKKSRG